MKLEHMLAKLISFPTVTGNRAAADALFTWVQHRLQPLPVHVRMYEHVGLPAMVITPTRRKQTRLWLVAHIDVVAGPDGLFRARRAGTRLIGRGAIDMKFAVACYLRLLEELGVGVREYDLGVMLTADEEWGSNSGVQYLLTREGYTGDVAFLPDGYGSWRFEEQAKGVWGVHVETHGIAAHGSKPWHGRSAINELVMFLNELQQRVQERCTTDDPEHWYTTLNIGTVEGGVAYNMVAPRAAATLDVRYVSARDLAKVQHIVRSINKRYPHTTVQTNRDEPPYGILRRNGYARAFAQCAAAEGVTCDWIKSHGSSDARFLNRANIPTLLIGPEGGESHGDTEWIDLPDLERYYRVLKQFVLEVGRKKK